MHTHVRADTRTVWTLPLLAQLRIADTRTLTLRAASAMGNHSVPSGAIMR